MSSWMSMLKAVAVAAADPKLGPDADAVTVTDDDAAAIRGMIRAQLAAFRQRDAEAAWAVCSAGLRDSLEDGKVLIALVEQKYAPLARRNVLTFGELALTPDGLSQPLTLTDEGGRIHHALYVVEREDAGWRVHGCVLLPGELPLDAAA